MGPERKKTASAGSVGGEGGRPGSAEGKYTRGDGNRRLAWFTQV